MPKYHINDNGEAKICTAKSSCHYRGLELDHFTTKKAAQENYEKIMNFESIKTLSKRHSPSLITLSSNVGSAEVVDGDLTDPRARVLLSSGLCGDLALAVHEKTGGDPYFLSYTVSSSGQLSKLFDENHDSIFHTTNHVMLASPTKDERFVDAYGQSDYEDIENNWDGAFIVKGTPEMLKHFADEENSKRLSNFADAVIELDRNEELYLMDLDELDDNAEYDEDDEY